jgi:hypothetical protein
MILKIFLPKNLAKINRRFLLKLLLVFAKKLIITLVFEKNANFVAKNWQKSQKIVIITSTPECSITLPPLEWSFSLMSSYKICFDEFNEGQIL